MSESPDLSPDTRAFALAGDLRTVIGKLKRRLRAQAGIGDWTPSQKSVLLRLERDGPATVSNLARLEGMRPQSMGAALAPLQAAGLVIGTADPDDGRQTLLSLSRACRKKIQERRAARQDWLSRTIAAKLSAAEQERLAKALLLLQRLAED